MARAGSKALRDLQARDIKGLRDAHGADPLANIILSLSSMVVIYSFLAVESFVNYHLYQKWLSFTRKDAGTEPLAKWFEGVAKFDGLRRTRLRRLPERLKALCFMHACPSLHEASPDLWQRFLTLSATSRHFLVHPVPEPEVLQEVFSQVLLTPPETFTGVPEGIIRYLHGPQPPDWVAGNTLLSFGPLEILPPARPDV